MRVRYILLLTTTLAGLLLLPACGGKGSSSDNSTNPPAATTPTIAASGQPQDQTVTAGQTATFTVMATGTAPLGYQWKKDNAAIDGATSASYTTPTTTTSDSGSTFTVTVSNSAGNITSSAATLTVNTSDTNAPTVPTNLSAAAVSATQINLAWTASTDDVGVTGYQIYRDGAKIDTSTTTSYTDTSLTASTSYTYTVRAYDAANHVSAPSTAASATTQASVQTGATFYVDQTNAQASDANAGTESQPWRTLEQALAAAVAGDTIIVKAGTYQATVGAWDSVFNPANSGTSDNPITFRSQPYGAAIIRKQSHTIPAWSIHEKSYITIDGFSIQGMLQVHDSDHVLVTNNDVTKGGLQSTDVSLNWGINIQGSPHCTVRNNYVHNLDPGIGNGEHNSAGIMIFGGSDYALVEYNTVDCGNIVYSAFGQKGGNLNDGIWRYNVGTNCMAGFMGMGSTDGSAYSRRHTYYQNIIHHAKRFIELNHNSTDFDLHNNTAYEVERFIVSGQNSNQNVTSYNNIAAAKTIAGTRGIFNAGYDCPEAPDPQSNAPSFLFAFEDFNLFSNFETWYFKEASGGTPPGTQNYSRAVFYSTDGFDGHSISEVPLFVNAGAGDFHLQNSSPALTAGRGGIYASTLGAYILGNENIGSSLP